MPARWVEYTPSERDEIISKVQQGELTPEQATALAKAKGWEPFEYSPPWPAYDPMQETHWSLAMAIAWIAWRDLNLVRERNAGYRAESTHWIFREVRAPSEDGKAFEHRKGWWLETLSRPTATQLPMLESILSTNEKLPETAQMSVREAESVLWRAFAEGHLTAEAMNAVGSPIEIPLIAWTRLKLYEERGFDVLKYNPLDQSVPFSDVKIRRADLARLWPKVARAEVSLEIQPSMLQPMIEGEAGYIPLCVALHWIMTAGGVISANINDPDKWRVAVGSLFPLLCTSEIELIGLASGAALPEPIPGHSLALIRILAPLSSELTDIVLEAPSHIVCTPYVDETHWHNDFNDRLYQRGRPGAAWSHLQVSKSQVLKHWSRPTPRISTETACRDWLAQQMKASPTRKPKSRESFWLDANKKYPALAKRQFIRAWDLAISETGAHRWSKAGRPSNKSNRRTN